MTFREYGRDTDQPLWKQYLPMAATAAVIGGYALLSKRFSSNAVESFISNKMVSGRTSDLFDRALNGITSPASHSLAKDEAIKILREPSGYRESFMRALGNSWLLKGVEKAGQYIQPIGLLESVFKIHELRYAAQNLAIRSDSSLMQGKLGAGSPVVYLKGALREWTGSEWKTLVKDVYPVKGGLSYLVEKIHKGPPDLSKLSQTKSWWNTIREHLDIGHIGKQYPTEDIKGMIARHFGFSESEDISHNIQYLHPAHPVKEVMGALGALAKGDYMGALGKINPGTHFSVFGKRFDLPATSLQELSTSHLLPYHLLNRINQSFARNKMSYFLALSQRSTGSALDLYLSMGLKRALPAYLIYEYGKYVNYEVGKHSGKDIEERIGDIRANAMLDLASIKDVTGVTRTLKRIHSIAPEQLERLAHPFTEQPVGLSREELKEYFATGREAIRKNRWWAFGSSEAFKGEKIDYWAPNWYQRTQKAYKDYAYTGTRYGSHEEYYANAWIPTIEHPFAPIHHLLNPFWLESKHLEDRPYPTTGKMFMDNIFGMPLNLTVGALLKPQKAMHRAEVSNSLRSLKTVNEEIKQRFYEQTYHQYYMYTSGGGRMSPMESIQIPGSPGSYPSGGLTGYISTMQKDKKESDQWLTTPYQQIDYATNQIQQTGQTILGTGAAFSEMENNNQMVANGLAIAPYSHEGAKQAARRTVEYINQRIAEKGYRVPYGTSGKVLPSGVLVAAKYPKPEWVSSVPRETAKQIGPVNTFLAGALHGFQHFEHLGGIYGFELNSAMKSVGINLHAPPTLETSKIGSFSRELYKDWDIGGIGNEFTEIFRRFIPKSHFGDTEINLIHNKMPSWLPHEYGIQFHLGDPYSKVAMGEVRMPGYAYEKAHHMNTLALPMVASTLGSDETKLIQYMLGMREQSTRRAQDIMDEGTEAHEKIQAEMKKKGVLIEAERDVYDPVHNIRGRLDAIVAGEGGQAEVLEIKTKANQEALEKLEGPEQQHIEQLMFYMHQTGLKTGYLHYATREDPSLTGPHKVFKINYNEEVFQYSMRKLEAARSVVRNMVGSGALTREELYTPMERFRVLADVAPYSKEYEYYKNYLGHTLDTHDEKRKEFSQIKREVSAVKQKVDITPYRFKYSDISTTRAVILKTIAPGLYMTSASLHPMRLAGVKIPGAKTEEGAHTRAELDKYLSPGTIVQLGYAKDSKQRIEPDTYGSIHAAMWTLGGDNISRALMKSGAVKEKEDDYRPASVHARFTPSEIWAGKLVENVSHYNVLYFHNKFMPIDSALEAYKRKEIYGKRFTSWDAPVTSMIIPALKVHAAEGPIDAALWGGMLGAWITKLRPLEELKGAERNWKGQMKYKGYGALIGAGIGLLANRLYNMAGHGKGGKAYIPGPVTHRREMDTYYDRLKYVKFRRLYEATRRVIKSKEHLDIEALARAIELKGGKALENKKRLEAQKRQDKVEGLDTAVINDQIKAIVSNRKRLDLTPRDVLAMQFRDEYKSTMYGLDPYGNYSNLYKAIPERERDYVEGFMNAPAQERTEILKLVPDDVGKLLRAKWYGESYEHESLEKYFKGKNLPSSDWIGWTPWRGLEDYKLASLEAEGQDIHEEGYWPSDVSRVKELGIKDIQPFRPSSVHHIMKESLRSLYRGYGLEDVIIDIHSEPSTAPGVHVNVDIDQDRTQEVKDYVERNQDKILK